MPPVAAGAVAIAIVLDLLVGEFPERVHPVVLFGGIVSAFDRSWTAPQTTGAIVALGLPILAAVLLGGLTEIAVRMHPAIGTVVAGLVLFSTISLRMLLSVASDVIDLTTSTLDSARTEVRSLVGRDASTLTAAEVRSAAVESVAENLADGFVAPLLAFAVGAQVSLGLAVGGAVWVKGVNTLDSMLGYESKPVGWASARLDDIAMWLPARLSAAVIAVAARDLRAVSRARRWASAPPSPNSGWPMATLALGLNVQLRKPGVYTLNPDEALPSVERAHRGIRTVGIAGLLAVVIAGVLAWL